MTECGSRKPLPPETPPVLEIRDLDFFWKGAELPLLKELNEKIVPGERVALVGANGAGKSTLLRLCGGLLDPTGGDIFLNGEPVRRILPRQRSSEIGFLFQDPERQIFHATVEEEILFSLRNEKFSADEKKARLERALNVTGLRGKEKTHPLDLNSAERRMVAVASLSVQDLRLLLLDEPTRELDDYWLDVFLKWMDTQTAAILTISHDPELVSKYFHRTWLLKAGAIEPRGRRRD